MNKINQEIINKLIEYEIPIDKAMGFLIPLYYGYTPDFVPEEIQMQVMAANIISYTIEENELQWDIPLFVLSNSQDPFDWVKNEYCVLFREINPTCPLMGEESKRRIIKLFKDRPDIRKQDVLGATKLYLLETNSKYIGEPHYFIEKGVGTAKTQKILSWIEKYLENEEETDNHSSRNLQ